MTLRLKFATRHVGPIVHGAKWVTVRVDLDRDVDPGGPLVLLDPDGTSFAKATVDFVGRNISARRFANASWRGHRSYRNVDELLADLRRYYPDEQIDPDTPLTVIAWSDLVVGPFEEGPQ